MSRRGGSPFDVAQDQVLHGVEADCSARDGVARCGSDVVEREHFHQPQNLHELALACLPIRASRRRRSAMNSSGNRFRRREH